MPQTVELQIGTKLKLGREIVTLAEAADVTFPSPVNTDGVAELLAASAREDLSMASNLNVNAATLNALAGQVIAGADGLAGYPEGTALNVTYGPSGEKIYTAAGVVPEVDGETDPVIELAAATIIVLTLTKAVVSPGEDPALGFSVTVDDVARAVDSAEITGAGLEIALTLESAVEAAEVVLLSYDQSEGDIESEGDGDEDPGGARLQSFADVAVTNNVV